MAKTSLFYVINNKYTHLTFVFITQFPVIDLVLVGDDIKALADCEVVGDDGHQGVLLALQVKVTSLGMNAR